MSEDKIAEIRARHEDAASIGSIIHAPGLPSTWTLVGWKAHHDRDFLLAENERLRDQIYESIPKWQANELQREIDRLQPENERQRAEIERLRAEIDGLEAELALMKSGFEVAYRMLGDKP